MPKTLVDSGIRPSFTFQWDLHHVDGYLIESFTAVFTHSLDIAPNEKHVFPIYRLGTTRHTFLNMSRWMLFFHRPAAPVARNSRAGPAMSTPWNFISWSCCGKKHGHCKILACSTRVSSASYIFGYICQKNYAYVHDNDDTFLYTHHDLS